MEDGKTRHVSISLILATQECCPIPGLDDLEAIVKEIGHRQCSLGAPFPIINPSVIDADKPAGRQLQVNRLCAVEMHLVAGNFIDLTTEKLLVPALPQLAVLAMIEVVGIQEDKVHVRSEEHTSELQSLMRNTYAVFCLKTKNKSTQ